MSDYIGRFYPLIVKVNDDKEKLVIKAVGT